MKTYHSNSSTNEFSLELNQKCNICYNFYSNENLPYVLRCGHTFCFKCVERIYKKEENKIQCAFDKKVYEVGSIQEIPLNFSFLQLLKAISHLHINNNCKFVFNPNSESNELQLPECKILFKFLANFHDVKSVSSENITVEDLSKCKTILELSFLKNQPQLKLAKDYLYNTTIQDLKNSTIYGKFCESKKFMALKKFIYDNGEYFEGVYQNGKKNGWGRKKNKIGVLFEGFYIDGNKDGYGIEISKTFDIYIGEFKNNLKSGHGIFFYNKPDSKYEGGFYMNKKHGKGKDTFADKSCYDGIYLNGMRTGEGMLTFPNGNFMKGEFLNGKLEGEGKEKNTNYRYKGNFRSGIKHGYGIIVYDDGNMYKGDFCEGKKHGKGEFRYSDGTIYVGDFFENKRQGEGRLEIISKNSKIKSKNLDNHHTISTYTGEFLNDCFDGKGVLVIKNKWTYKGEFKMGMKHGYGILTYENKDEYRGYFENDSKSGKGEMYYKDRDTLVSGVWKEDKIIKYNRDF
jgi:hypothetical protein